MTSGNRTDITNSMTRLLVPAVGVEPTPRDLKFPCSPLSYASVSRISSSALTFLRYWLNRISLDKGAPPFFQGLHIAQPALAEGAFRLL